jgi:hypothetical protein
MKCEEARAHLSAYLDDMLEQDIRAQLEDHLNKCERCNEELNELKSLIDSVSSLDQVMAPSDFLDNVKERLEPRFNLPKFIKTIFLPLQIKIPIQAAAVAVSVLLVLAIVQQLKRSTDEFPRPMASKPINTAEVSKKETLPEKTKPAKDRLSVQELPKIKGTSYKKESTDKTDNDRKMIEPQGSIIGPEKVKKDVRLRQPGPVKEDGKNDLVFKTGTRDKTSIETDGLTQSIKKQQSESQIESGMRLSEEKEEIQMAKPIELVLFIDQSKPALTQAKAMESMKRSEKTSASGMAGEEGAVADSQKATIKAELEAKQSEHQEKDRESSSTQEISRLTPQGFMEELQQIVFEYKGKVLTSIQSYQITTPSLLKTEIPVESYHDFCNKLKALSPQTNCPSFVRRSDQNMIPVNIKIFQK